MNTTKASTNIKSTMMATNNRSKNTILSSSEVTSLALNSSQQNSSDLVRLVRILDSLQKKKINLDDASEFIRDITYAERVLLVLLSPLDGDIYIEAASGLSSEQKKQGHYVVGEGVVGKVIQTGEPLYIHDVMHNPLFLNRTHARDQKEKISFLCVPIKFNDKTIGALGIDRLSDKVQDSEHEERLLSVIANSFMPYIRLHQSTMQKHYEEPVRFPKPSSSKNARYLVGNSEAMQLIFERIGQAAPSSTTVMLRGESGTGKELVARALHENSPRKDSPFITLNCAALPESLVESELFGHEKGAFTGALHTRKGRFELAHTGTLFLDEVGELSLATQARLLRVLQERSFERVGSEQSHQVDVRIITATNKPLEEMVEEGSFRKDLYYRLNVFAINLPPLRERKSDILLLVDHFLNVFSKQNNREKPKVSLAASEMLQQYSWPGNIRELENIIERSFLLIGKNAYILPQHLPLELHSVDCPINLTKSKKQNISLGIGTLPEQVEELEKNLITKALETHKGHIGAAAAALSITERIIGQRMRKYEIDYKKFRQKGINKEKY